MIIGGESALSCKYLGKDGVSLSWKIPCPVLTVGLSIYCIHDVIMFAGFFVVKAEGLGSGKQRNNHKYI